MARKPGIATPVYVVDTSYLTELLGVPGASNERGMREVRNRIREATRRGYLLFVPIPCLFELANHISDLGDEGRRRQLAGDLLKSIILSLETGKPWSVIPSGPSPELLGQIRTACETFAQNHVRLRGLGLTDSFSAQEARRLKAKYHGLNYRVHIWTRDRDLKRLEPDEEVEPFVT